MRQRLQRLGLRSHVPVVHVPVADGPQGLPVGVTIVGAVGADRATLRAADWIHTRLGGGEQDREEG